MATGQLSTFDIFDTVLTRRVGNPHSLFLLLGRRAAADGLISCSAHAFAEARRLAERQTFRNAGGLDSSVSLVDIHSEVADALELDAEQMWALIDLEYAVEREMLVPIPAAAARVTAARAAGREVMFVSDMYLPAEFLRSVLASHQLIEPGESVLVSNEVAKSKATGALWSYVRELYPDHDIVHCGNDELSDGRRARKSGVRTALLTEQNLNRYEHQLEAHAGATDGLTSAMAGASRIARLDPTEPGRRPIVDVSAGVVAPFVIGNVLWTLQTAKKMGLEKLFFVARDGKVLCEVAQTLAPKVGYTGDLEYIYGSRQAWCLASYTPKAVNALDALVPAGTDVDATLTEVLARVEMRPSEIQGVFRQRFPESTWDRPLSADAGDVLRGLLREDPDLSFLLTERSKKARELVLGYLSQVGALTAAPIGFVDLGTGASLYNALSAILDTVGQAPPTGFYFGLRSHLPETAFGRPRTYVRNEERGLGYLRTPGLLTFVELACTADHGSVTGYREAADGSVVPTLCEDDNQPVVDWGLQLVHSTVRRVAEELVLNDTLVGSESIDLRPAIMDVFDLFWNKPTRAEAMAWGTYPFEDGWGENATRNTLASRRRVHHAVAPQPHRHWWNGGARKLSGPVTRAAFDSRAIAQRVQQKATARRVRGN